MNCYTIPASEPFLRTLAQWVLSEYGDNPAVFTSTVILLPNRRACRSLREVFLDTTEGKPLLLPRIQPIGDVEDNSHLLAPATHLLPAIHPLRRQLLLMKLVNNFERTRQGRAYTMDKTAQLAAQLATLMDEVEREELDFSRLENLVPEELQEHWQQTLNFLKIVTRYWPDTLKEEGCSNPVAYRNDAIKNLAADLIKNPPTFPIIAAGSTGSHPATASLLSAISKLPHGHVILPALDTYLGDEEWKLLDTTHPQYILQQLLNNMGCKRENVQSLASPIDSLRGMALREIFKPAESTSEWQNSIVNFAEGLKNLYMIQADTLQEEARYITVLLRTVLETPKKTAALITPDRTLARMVSAQMRRFGITIDDSAGASLKDTTTATFLRLTIEAVSSSLSPVTLLALLRHPMTACGTAPHECRFLAGILDKYLLRGIRKQPDLLGLAADAKELKQDKLAEFLTTLHEHMAPLMDVFSHKHPMPLKEMLQLHIQLTEWLATTAEESGNARLWGKESGNNVARWIAQLYDHADILSEIDPRIYPATFDALLAMQSYWPQRAQHPRIHILSPIEARLLQYDCVILSGLTETSWPQASEPDPWMSRPMRQAFGLPSPERRIGQAAHDVYNHMSANEVWLTRARKTDGSPTVDSRWLVRLETLVRAKSTEVFARISNQLQMDIAKDYMDLPITCTPLAVPEPRPPASARPTKMSATSIDKWIADPYAIYAQYILRLKRLDDLDKDPNAADLGKLIHKALELFTQKFPKTLPDDAYNELLACGRLAFLPFAHQPAAQCLWWPRFESIAEWVIEQEKERRKHISELLAEVKGVWQCDVNGKPFTLTTSIDRLEINKDKTLIIADYKTGYVPDGAQLKLGLGNQLYVEALIAQHGILLPKPDHAIKQASQLEYWKLAATKNDSRITLVPAHSEILATRQTALFELIAAYQDETQPYRAQDNPKLILKYNDYEHLTRRAEWETL